MVLPFLQMETLLPYSVGLHVLPLNNNKVVNKQQQKIAHFLQMTSNNHKKSTTLSSLNILPEFFKLIPHRNILHIVHMLSNNTFFTIITTEGHKYQKFSAVDARLYIAVLVEVGLSTRHPM